MNTWLKAKKKKAVELYRELSKDDTSNPVIYNNYFNLLLELGSFDEAQSYLKRNLRKDPENYQ